MVLWLYSTRNVHWEPIYIFCRGACLQMHHRVEPQCLWTIIAPGENRNHSMLACYLETATRLDIYPGMQTDRMCFAMFMMAHLWINLYFCWFEFIVITHRGRQQKAERSACYSKTQIKYFTTFNHRVVCPFSWRGQLHSPWSVQQFNVANTAVVSSARHKRHSSPVHNY